jgi:NAD(P)H-dependent flavin oxidoreductase YrpB (nitropropane dioxygenase family)
MHTRFTALVGCEVPIQLAPMGTISTPELVAAVTAVGAMGMTSMPMAPPEAVAEALDRYAEAAQGPFGFNVLMPFLDAEVVDVAAQGCRLVDFYHGDPDPTLVERVHRNDALAGWQVGSVASARAAADAGCDLLVVRGTEGGGRMYGSRSLWPLLVEVLDAVDVPVLAAGGIAEGRGVAAALAAGAAGVRMGTRFVATPESGAHPDYKDAIVAASGSETVLTDSYRVMWPSEQAHARVLRSALEHASALPEDASVGKMTMGPMTVDIPRFGIPPPTATTEGDVDAMALYAGESVASINAVEPAGELVRRIAADAEFHLRAPAQSEKSPS